MSFTFTFQLVYLHQATVSNTVQLHCNYNNLANSEIKKNVDKVIN